MADRQIKFGGRNKGTLRPDRKKLRQDQAADRKSVWDAMTEDERRAAKKARGEKYIPKEGVK